MGSDGPDHSVLKVRLQRVEVLEKENMKLKELAAPQSTTICPAELLSLTPFFPVPEQAGQGL